MEVQHLQSLLQDVHIDSDIIACDLPSKHTTLSEQYPNMLRRQLSTPPEMEMDQYSEYSDDDYFSQSYAPLSCMPTPPPTHQQESPFTQALNAAFDGQQDDIENLGPAIHLCNLIPTSVSLITPSPAIMQEILLCANQKEQTVCLAALILDSLTYKFSALYRKGMPLEDATESQKDAANKPHVDLIRPEIIALAALLLASKCVTDSQVHTSMAKKAGDDQWSCRQINHAEMCILENLNWKVMSLCVEEELNIAKADMERAGRNARKRLLKRLGQTDAAKKEGGTEPAKTGINSLLTPNDSFDNLERLGGGQSGNSCWAQGQITPAESP